MKLDAIAEIHPGELITSAFAASYFGPTIEEHVRWNIVPSAPAEVFAHPHWNALAEYLRQEGRAVHERKKAEGPEFESLLYTDAQFERVLFLALQQVDLARQIWHREAEQLQREPYRRIFLESDGWHPLGVLARSQSRDCVFLDTNNPPYVQLSQYALDTRNLAPIAGAYTKDNPAFVERREQLHRARERIWVERIASNPDNGLLVVGADHLADTYGLRTELAAQGITLRVVMQFTALLIEFDRLAEEREAIDRAASDLSPNSLLQDQ